MDLDRLRELAGTGETRVTENEQGYEDIMADLDQVLSSVNEHGFPDDIAENIHAVISSCMEQIEEILSDVPYSEEEDY